MEASRKLLSKAEFQQLQHMAPLFIPTLVNGADFPLVPTAHARLLHEPPAGAIQSCFHLGVMAASHASTQVLFCAEPWSK
jgi:hypothetical protein